MTTINDKPQHLLARYADRTGCDKKIQVSEEFWSGYTGPMSMQEYVSRGGKIRLVLSEYGLPSHLKPYKDNPRLPGDGYRVPTGEDSCNQPHEFYSNSDGVWKNSPPVEDTFSVWKTANYRLPASVLPPDWDEMTREDEHADAPAKLPRPGQPQDDVQALKARVQELEGKLGQLRQEYRELNSIHAKCQSPESSVKVLTRALTYETGREDGRSEVLEAFDSSQPHIPTLRPIAEMPAEVPEGCVRVFGGYYENQGRWLISSKATRLDTHFLDIRLPAPPDPDEELRREFEAWMKGYNLQPDELAFQAFKAGRCAHPQGAAA